MRLFQSLAAFCGCCLTSFGMASTQKATLLSTLQIPNPAFVSYLPKGPDEHPDLIVSSFSMFGGTRVSRVNVTRIPHAPIGSEDIRVVNQTLVWPNEVTPVPESILGQDYLAVATGFLVPGRSTGAISILNLKTGESFDITTPKSGYFYHRTLFQDMNGDGRLDIVTARGTKPLIGSSQGELLWLEQPAANPRDMWQEHLIAHGPDVYFRLVDLDQDGTQEIIAAEFFSRRLSVHWRAKDQWLSRVIDESLGAAFDLALGDLNGDGHLDLVVTNHEGKSGGAIYAYHIPSHFKVDSWTRKTLLQGIRTELRGINQAAPGTPLIWEQSHGKPHILVAGDGSTKVHWLVPNSEDSHDWTYEARILLDTDSTIGSMSLSSRQDDGSRQLYVPAYDKSQIHIFKLNEM